MANEVLNSDELKKLYEDLDTNLVNPAMHDIDQMEKATQKAIEGRTDLDEEARNRIFEATKRSIDLSAQFLAEALKTSENAIATVDRFKNEVYATFKDDNFTNAEKQELKAHLYEVANDTLAAYQKEQAEANKSFLGDVWKNIKQAVQDFGHKDNVEKNLEDETKKAGKSFLRRTYDRAADFVKTSVDRITEAGKDFVEKHSPDKDKPGLKDRLSSLAEQTKSNFSKFIEDKQASLGQFVENMKADVGLMKENLSANAILLSHYKLEERDARRDIFMNTLQGKVASAAAKTLDSMSGVAATLQHAQEEHALRKEEKQYEKLQKTSAMDYLDPEYGKNLQAKREALDKSKNEDRDNLFARKAAVAQDKMQEAYGKAGEAAVRLESARAGRQATPERFARPDQNARNYNRINFEKPILLASMRKELHGLMKENGAYDLFKEADARLKDAQKSFSLIRGEKSLTENFSKDQLTEMYKLNKEISALTSTLAANKEQTHLISGKDLEARAKEVIALCDKLEEVCKANEMAKPAVDRQAKEYAEEGYVKGSSIRADAMTVKNITDALNAPEYANTELFAIAEGSKVIDTYDRIPVDDGVKKAADTLSVLPPAAQNAAKDIVNKMQTNLSAETKVSTVEATALISKSTGRPVLDISVHGNDGTCTHGLYSVSDKGSIEMFAMLQQSGADIVQDVSIIAYKPDPEAVKAGAGMETVIDSLDVDISMISNNPIVKAYQASNKDAEKFIKDVQVGKEAEEKEMEKDKDDLGLDD